LGVDCVSDRTLDNQAPKRVAQQDCVLIVQAVVLACCLGDSCDCIVAVEVTRNALSSSLPVPKADLLQSRHRGELPTPRHINTYHIESRIADSRCLIQARK